MSDGNNGNVQRVLDILSLSKNFLSVAQISKYLDDIKTQAVSEIVCRLFKAGCLNRFRHQNLYFYQINPEHKRFISKPVKVKKEQLNSGYMGEVLSFYKEANKAVANKVIAAAFPHIPNLYQTIHELFRTNRLVKIERGVFQFNSEEVSAWTCSMEINSLRSQVLKFYFQSHEPITNKQVCIQFSNFSRIQVQSAISQLSGLKMISKISNGLHKFKEI